MKVKCVGCEKESDFSLKTRSVILPHETAVEAFISCPHCGRETHTHFLTKAMVNKQLEIRKASTTFILTKNHVNFNRLSKLRKEYTDLFNQEQEVCRSFLEKVSAKNVSIS